MRDSAVVTYVVPQGAVLGPLFLVLYLNELFSVKISRHFANDTVFFL